MHGASWHGALFHVVLQIQKQIHGTLPPGMEAYVFRFVFCCGRYGSPGVSKPVLPSSAHCRVLLCGPFRVAARFDVLFQRFVLKRYCFNSCFAVLFFLPFQFKTKMKHETVFQLRPGSN